MFFFGLLARRWHVATFGIHGASACPAGSSKSNITLTDGHVQVAVSVLGTVHVSLLCSKANHNVSHMTISRLKTQHAAA
jgi:hypothetical protein